MILLSTNVMGIILLFLVFGMFFAMVLSIAYAAFNTFKLERLAKLFRPNIKVGDKALKDNSTECEIIDTDTNGDGKFVTIKLVISKSRIYPPIED